MAGALLVPFVMPPAWLPPVLIDSPAAHIAAFALVAVLAWPRLPGGRPRRLAGLAAFALATELVQIPAAGHGFYWGDMAADGAGVALGLAALLAQRGLLALSRRMASHEAAEASF